MVFVRGDRKFMHHTTLRRTRIEVYDQFTASLAFACYVQRTRRIKEQIGLLRKQYLHLICHRDADKPNRNIAKKIETKSRGVRLKCRSF